MRPEEVRRNEKLFDQTRKNFTRVFRQLNSNKKDDAVLAEAAFPAYAHHNPLINHIMWRRLRIVFDYINRHPAARVLDFGCGSGVAAYLLGQAGHTVVMFDTEYWPLKLTQSVLAFPGKITTTSLAELTTVSSHQQFDFIITLDVLEHIKSLSQQVALFRHVLKTGGELLVSGPTENWLYQIGRRLAGREFSGDYHVSDIRLIQHELATHARIKHLATIYPLLPLFKVFAARIDK